jgi:hypothetical protein
MIQNLNTKGESGGYCIIEVKKIMIYQSMG